MTQSRDQYSFVQDAIGRLSDHMHEEDVLFGVSQQRVNPFENCDGLATIEESYFTAILCNTVVEEMSRRGKPVVFHEFIDTPSRPTEHHLGSDISIGQYDSIFRIRVMHKVLRKHWCDRGWYTTFRYRAERIGTFPFLFLFNFAVLPTYQRRGIGTELLNRVKERTCDAPIVVRGVNREAYGALRRAGFWRIPGHDDNPIFKWSDLPEHQNDSVPEFDP